MRSFLTRGCATGLLLGAGLLGSAVQVARAGSVPSQQIAAGGFHTCMISQGALQCWGENFYGQVGDGSTHSSLIPVPVAGLDRDVTVVAAGAYHTCAVVDGGVQCWGYNEVGQLGTGDTFDSATPDPVVGFAAGRGVTAVAAGAGHTCAILNAGLKCWGHNWAGQLGTGAAGEPEPEPVDVATLGSGVTAVVAGDAHTCAIVGGGIWCWGANDYGQLGLGNMDPQQLSVPMQVPGFSSGVTALVAGSYHTCAVVNDEHVFCWGHNKYGQLGDGSTNDRATPVSILHGTVTALAAGGLFAGGLSHTCAVVNDQLQCWGANHYGQLGNGATADSLTPVAGPALSAGILSLETGWAHTCAALTNGRAYCWGSDFSGELGDGGLPFVISVPTVSPALAGIGGPSAGAAHACGLSGQSGLTMCWGANESGQLGRGTTAADAFPGYLNFSSPSPSIQSVASGGAHSCAVSAAGDVYCWGANDFGQIGNDNLAPALTPVGVDGFDNSVETLGAGQSHTCAILANSQIRCWGRGSDGQLGNFTFNDSWMPVTVVTQNGMFNTALTGATAVVAGRAHACAVVSDGVRCWGANNAGQRGDGTNLPSSRAVAVSGIAGGVLALAAGRDYNCAVTSDGKARCWGENGSGQLGDGTLAARLMPVIVRTNAQSMLDNVVAIAAADYHSCALRDDGSVWCWGNNNDGQLGTGSFAGSSYAVQTMLPPDSGVTALTAGDGFTCASAPTQTWCWGGGYQGRLGNGELGYSPVPVLTDSLFRDGFE